MESEINDSPWISQEENNILIANFSEKEVYDAIMQMEKKLKARDQMGFPWSFTKSFGRLLSPI